MGMIIFACIVLFILFLFLMPVKAIFTYDDQMKIYIRYLFIKIQAFPEKKTVKGKKVKEKKPKKEMKIVNLRKFIRFIQQIIEDTSDLIKKILDRSTITKCNLEMIIATGDAAKTASQYGEACAAVGTLFGYVKSKIEIRHYHIQIRPDFDANKFHFRLEAVLSIQLLSLFITLARQGYSFASNIMKSKRLKGGIQHE